MQNHPHLEASRLNGVVGNELLFPLMLKMRIRHHAILSHSRPMERIWQTLHFLNQRFLCYSWQLGELKILEFQEKPGIKTFLFNYLSYFLQCPHISNIAIESPYSGLEIYHFLHS